MPKTPENFHELCVNLPKRNKPLGQLQAPNFNGFVIGGWQNSPMVSLKAPNNAYKNTWELFPFIFFLRW